AQNAPTAPWKTQRTRFPQLPQAFFSSAKMVQAHEGTKFTKKKTNAAVADATPLIHSSQRAIGRRWPDFGGAISASTTSGIPTASRLVSRAAVRRGSGGGCR